MIAAQTGHVNVHEAGAIEFTGHKVLALPQKNGKLEPETLRAYMEAFYKDPSHDHMVFPGMVSTFPIRQSLELFIRKQN